MSEHDNDDIFQDVSDTEVPKTQHDPAKQLYLIPEDKAEWFVPKKAFDSPKDVKGCTAELVVRFISWQISAEHQSVYQGSGLSQPGTLRNQMVVRYHPVPDGYDDEMSGRVPCQLQFGSTCKWCAEKTKAEKRFPREQQPPEYFKKVIAQFKPKDRTFMLGYIYEKDNEGNWATDYKLRAFEFANYLKNGRPFIQIINDRANDADKRIRIDKKTYAGYVSPVALKLTWSWPQKAGKPEKGQYSAWTPTDATPFPVEAGGPDVSVSDKAWALALAKQDPAAWINKDAFAKVNPAEVGQWVYDVFTGKVSAVPEVDLGVADFGQLLEIIGKNKEKFDAANVDPAEYTYDDAEALRQIVKGVLNG